MSDVCFGCDSCPFTGPNIPPNLHEIHVTIEPPNDVERFKTDCESLEMKAVMLDLDGTMLDVMTTWATRGDKVKVLNQAVLSAMSLIKLGYAVKRIKIETTLTNPIANKCAPDNYYETHFAIRFGSQSEHSQLRSVVDRMSHKWHMSNSLFKPDVQMLTMRSYNGIVREHILKVMVSQEELSEQGFIPIKIINEYCWYDSNVNHDKVWLDV